MRNTGLYEAQAGIKIAERNINNVRYADNPTLMIESEEELKTLLMKVKEESEKVGLKTWKQPRCPLGDEWIRKQWYVYTMEYYSANKKQYIWISSNEVDETGADYRVK